MPTKPALVVLCLAFSAFACADQAESPENDASVSTEAAAASATLLYSYKLASASNPVPNGGTVTAPLDLRGDFSVGAKGVQFYGDLVSRQSIGVATPAGGSSLNAPAAGAVGFGVDFTHPTPPQGCFSDSPNVTQIGRFAAGAGQLKLQYSNCHTSMTHVFVECRVAGSLSTTSTMPVKSSLALVPGHEYVATCVKSPDASGHTTLTLAVTPAGGATTTDTFRLPAIGAVTSSSALSVANKYPLPPQGSNTDQFIGVVRKVAYCQAAAVSAVDTCLGAQLPL